MSQITTHVLDTSMGKPAEGIRAKLSFLKLQTWNEIAEGVTNIDGRISDLIRDESILDKGIYKISFDTDSYFKKKKIERFYPFVEIVFEIDTGEHYHIPLLLSPFGYSTYRGS
ncbi:MAG: hydroxyisourate hydrolase [Bacteroidota bacterium]|nr:hydroxyisourate hydrolase [Bacteroidota bacterium]